MKRRKCCIVFLLILSIFFIGCRREVVHDGYASEEAKESLKNIDEVFVEKEEIIRRDKGVSEKEPDETKESTEVSEATETVVSEDPVGDDVSDVSGIFTFDPNDVDWHDYCDEDGFDVDEYASALGYEVYCYQDKKAMAYNFDKNGIRYNVINQYFVFTLGYLCEEDGYSHAIDFSPYVKRKNTEGIRIYSACDEKILPLNAIEDIAVGMKYFMTTDKIVDSEIPISDEYWISRDIVDCHFDENGTAVIDSIVQTIDSTIINEKK